MSGFPRPVDAELTAPLELPAVPGKPLTTQGGNTLDDGSGNMTIVGTSVLQGGLQNPPGQLFGVVKVTLAEIAGQNGLLLDTTGSDQALADVAGKTANGQLNVRIEGRTSNSVTGTVPELQAYNPTTPAIYFGVSASDAEFNVPLSAPGLQLGSNFSGSSPDIHADGASVYLEAHGGNIWARQNSGTNVQGVALAPGISVFGATGTTVASITDTGHINPNPTTPALPANPPVSGTVYQNTTGGPIIITVPITATAVGGSGQWALGSTNTPGDWGGAEQIGVSGEVHNMTLYVPNNWYWSLTATSATIGTASVLGL